jgi:uncharacterized membrane protein YidH (DUF202 family)
MRILGIVLLIVGVVVLVFGIYNFVTFNQSIGGKFAKAFGVSSRTDAVRNAVLEVIIGAVCVGAGFFLYRKG